MRKVIWLSSIILMVLAGCTQPAKPGNKIVLWHWMTDRNDTLQQLATEYGKETGIEVSVELFAPSDSYSQKVIAAAQASILPDIYGILDKKTIVADFIQAGFVSNLTQDMEANGGEWKNQLFDKALADKRFEDGNTYGVKPGIYGVPIDVTNEQVLYNKKLLAHAGIARPPQTFDEFMDDSQKLRRVGITPFVSGWGELWLLDCFASNYAFNIMGDQKIFDTYRGKVKYTDPDWIKVFSLFAEMRDKGLFIDGIVTKGNKYAEQDFALERTAFAFNGSWCVDVYHDMNPNLDYGVIPPPPLSNASYPLKIWGSAGSVFVVNASSPNHDKAIAFLKWLTAKEQQIVLAEQTYNLPSNKEALSVVSPVLAEFAKGMEQSTHPNVWPVNENPTVVEAFDRGLQAIIIGEKTPQQVGQDVQMVKDKQTAEANS